MRNIRGARQIIVIEVKLIGMGNPREILAILNRRLVTILGTTTISFVGAQILARQRVIADVVIHAAVENRHRITVVIPTIIPGHVIHDAAALPPEQWPEALPEPLPIEASALLKKLRAVGQREGERLDIVPELMLRKKTLEALLKSGYPNGPYQLPDSLRGWRRELMGQALLDCLAGD